MDIKKRIKKLEEERQPVTPAGPANVTPIKEISIEEWNAVYAPMIQQAYEESIRPKAGSDSSN